ncbi:GNAT family N-acetyltransferase [Pseudomonas synxantha]|uniref:GNAT family N-acetyltransferase n=1 Tax=Pseudomonas synxantha TaxID=47883 RepID=A0ABS0UPK9_9PSED|nr:GNAT family N-acetyltransferase [Pseudomonas synxantha]MBI6567539.1 GNAT family N-acetyltransferase [Pseudomonas synxantha]MBI6582346.1 GNAT family N-acetyltransferase [Pseudomonas synxantha]MBI6645411.1 GNAT family N-acetyltransferase [Pseudomonas synxantha]
MKRELDVADLNQSIDVGEAKHQDGYLGYQQRYFSSYLHWSFDGTNEWAVHFSIGMATNQQKRFLVEEISQAGYPLNEVYFINKENLELWIDGELAGLCRYVLSGHGDDVSLDETAEKSPADRPYRLNMELQAVFVRPQFHSMGFGSALCQQLADTVCSGILNRLFPNPIPSPSIELTLFCDYNSEAGESFFNELADQLETKLSVIQKAKGLLLRIVVDAGY